MSRGRRAHRGAGAARPPACRGRDPGGPRCTRTTYRGERDPAGRKVPVDVPDSGFEIPLDTLILAISQHALLDFSVSSVQLSRVPATWR